MPGTSAPSIPALFRGAVDDAGGSTWLLAGDRTWTYGEALGAIERLAGGCRAAGMGRGDRVLVTPRSEPEFLLLWLALMELGAVQVAIDPRASAAELAGFLAQVEPQAVVTDAGLAPAVRAAAADVGGGAPVLDVADLAAADADGAGPAAVGPDDVAVMIPTSGTTGRSKLVMQTHRAYVMAGEGFPWWMGLGADDRLMTALPLFHINAPAYSALGSVAARAGLVLLPRFSASGFLDAARRYGATEFNAIGAMLEILMRQPPRPDDADTPLRLCYTGPSPERARQEEMEARFGLEIVCGYGLSESPYGLVWPRGTRPFGALGAARQHPTLGHVNDARVRDPDADGVGELELRNPVIMRGYYGMPEETAAVVVDGWLRTGDLVHDDGDGIYTFVGRRKEVIRRRGENLSPTEVEAAAERHAGVAEAAVVGVPSELSEEEVKAFVVPADGAALDVAALDGFLRTQLTRFKVPRYYEVVDELPHTPTGRLAKHRLPAERTPGEVDMEAEEEEGSS
ncbi:MAG TPA: AMP-binding protein [Acidimicrobiales bacterium]|nr:AMP-binding protein [Acidimicrobiales bacterium]